MFTCTTRLGLSIGRDTYYCIAEGQAAITCGWRRASSLRLTVTGTYALFSSVFSFPRSVTRFLSINSSFSCIRACNNFSSLTEHCCVYVYLQALCVGCLRTYGSSPLSFSRLYLCYRFLQPRVKHPMFLFHFFYKTVNQILRAHISDIYRSISDVNHG